MGDMTVVYYTANAEDESFERKIRGQLIRAVGDSCPIISVSQKPIDLGKNICVGEVGCHYWNSFRQLRIGIEEAKTKYIAAAEADVLYPPEYFRFDPPTNECYHYTNFYAMWRRLRKRNVRGFYAKAFSEGAQTCGRDYWLSQLKRIIKDDPMWMHPGDVCQRVHVFGKYGWKSRKGGFKSRQDCPTPVIGIKTGQGLSGVSGTIKGRLPVDELPYWGSAHDLRVWLFGNCYESCKCINLGVQPKWA